MPRTNLTPKPNKLTLLIRGYYPTYTALAEVLGCSIPTAKTKMEQPEKLTIADMMRINKKGHIEAELIREAIQFN